MEGSASVGPLAPLVIGISIALGMTGVIVGLGEALRSRHYARQKQARRQIRASLVAQYGFEAATRSARLQNYRKLLSQDSERAVSAESRAHRLVLAAVGAAFVAFISLALATTVLEDSGPVSLTLLFAEVAATLVAFWSVRSANQRVRDWTNERAFVELQRQFSFLDGLFGSANLSTGGLTAVYLDQGTKIRTALTSAESLVSGIRLIWRERRSYYLSRWNDANLPEADTAMEYLEERTLRQLAWFKASLDRVSRATRIRGRALQSLYAIVTLLLAFEVAVHPGGYFESWTEFALLCATGGAAFLTSLHFSQNLHAVKRLYSRQRSRIELWLSNVAAEKVGSSTRLKSRLSYRELIDFEELMVDELLEWIESTSEDTVELAP